MPNGNENYEEQPDLKGEVSDIYIYDDRQADSNSDDEIGNYSIISDVLMNGIAEVFNDNEPSANLRCVLPATNDDVSSDTTNKEDERIYVEKGLVGGVGSKADEYQERFGEGGDNPYQYNKVFTLGGKTKIGDVFSAARDVVVPDNMMKYIGSKRSKEILNELSKYEFDTLICHSWATEVCATGVNTGQIKVKNLYLLSGRFDKIDESKLEKLTVSGANGDLVTIFMNNPVRSILGRIDGRITKGPFGLRAPHSLEYQLDKKGLKKTD